jgi:hypothetical protein
MGSCLSRADIPYTVLRQSVFGQLIPESLFPAFYQACKVESNALVNYLHTNILQSFYLVLSGEVVAFLSQDDGDPVLCSVFQAGDVIFFFPPHCSTCCNNGSIKIGRYKITYQFRSVDSGIAQVLGADRAAMERFLDNHTISTGGSNSGNNLMALKSFLFETNLTKYLQLSGFKDLTAEQVFIRH